MRTQALLDADRQNALLVGSSQASAVRAPPLSAPARQARDAASLSPESPPPYSHAESDPSVHDEKRGESAPFVAPYPRTSGQGDLARSAAGPSSALGALLAPIQRGVQYARHEVLEKPQLRREVRKQVKLMVHEAGRSQRLGEPEPAAALYAAADALWRRHDLYLYYNADPFSLTVRTQAITRSAPMEPSEGNALMLALDSDDNACVVQTLLTIARDIRADKGPRLGLEFGQELSNNRMDLNRWIGRRRKPILDKIFAGEDAAAAHDVDQLFTILQLANTAFYGSESIAEWPWEASANRSKEPVQPVGFGTVLMPGLFPSALEEHGEAGRQLLQLLTDCGCTDTLAVLLRAEKQGALRTAYLKATLSDACQAALDGQFSRFSKLLADIHSSTRHEDETLASQRPEAFLEMLRAVMPGAVTEVDDQEIALQNGQRFYVDCFEFDLPPGHNARWFEVAQAFGLSSENLFLPSTGPGWGLTTQVDGALERSKDSSAWTISPVCLGYSTTTTCEDCEEEEGSESLLVDPSAQRVAWFSFGLQARQGTCMGERWNTPLSGPVAARLAQSLASETESQEALAFLRALIARDIRVPSTVKVALQQGGALSPSLPDDVRAWVEA